MNTRPATHRVAASLDPGSRARCAASAKITRPAAFPSTRRPAASLGEIVRGGGRRMLAAALEDEVAAYVAAHAAEREENRQRLVVRNGHARPRKVTTVAGEVEVIAPRVIDRRVDEVTGERQRFRSAILPPWCRTGKSPKIIEVLPLLYLHGLSSKDFVPALEQFLGSPTGLSASAITRLTQAGRRSTSAGVTAACLAPTTSPCGRTG
jgi:putative transposase